MDNWLVAVIIAAFVGGVTGALLGWADSKEPFDGRRFVKSVAASLLAAVTVGLAYQLGPSPGIRDVLLALGLGAGIDNLTNRTLGALKAGPPRPPGGALSPTDAANSD